MTDRRFTKYSEWLKKQKEKRMRPIYDAELMSYIQKQEIKMRYLIIKAAPKVKIIDIKYLRKIINELV